MSEKGQSICPQSETASPVQNRLCSKRGTTVGSAHVLQTTQVTSAPKERCRPRRQDSEEGDHKGTLSWFQGTKGGNPMKSMRLVRPLLVGLVVLLTLVPVGAGVAAKIHEKAANHWRRGAAIPPGGAALWS